MTINWELGLVLCPGTGECVKLVPTQWSTVADKEKFIKHFQRFVKAGMPMSLFPDWFYKRLSSCFGHIAHYDRYGFYEEWFSSDIAKLRFLDHCVRFPCYGDPGYTYSDAEKILVAWIREAYPTLAEEIQRAREYAQAVRVHIASIPPFKIGEPTPALPVAPHVAVPKPEPTEQRTLFDLAALA